METGGMDRKGDRTQIRSTLEKRNAEILQVKNEITKILQVPKTRTCLNAELPQLELLRFEGPPMDCKGHIPSQIKNSR